MPAATVRLSAAPMVGAGPDRAAVPGPSIGSARRSAVADTSADPLSGTPVIVLARIGRPCGAGASGTAVWTATGGTATGGTNRGTATPSGAQPDGLGPNGAVDREAVDDLALDRVAQQALDVAQQRRLVGTHERHGVPGHPGPRGPADAV